jgi:hypothetical protein
MSYSELLQKLPIRYDGKYTKLAEHTKDFIESYIDDWNGQVQIEGDLLDNGYLSEYAHNQTPIYYQDLGTWFRDNWEAVNTYFEAVGSNNSDIMLSVQNAYTYTLENELYEFLQDLVNG